MNVTILCIGHMKDKSLDTLQKEYLKRLSAFCKAEVVEVKDEANAHADRPAEAQLIAMQAMKGAVAVLEGSGMHPAVAIDKVTTPGGLTIRGLNELDHAGFNSAVIKCLKAGLNSSSK